MNFNFSVQRTKSINGDDGEEVFVSERERGREKERKRDELYVSNSGCDFTIASAV